MIFHNLFGRHLVDFKASHWSGGRFISHCTVCGSEMIKLPGLPWKLSERRS